MNKYVLDTNILAVANGFADHLPERAREKCSSFITALYKDCLVFVDSIGFCFQEYFRYANRSGQPSVADAFAKWLWDNRFTNRACRLVDITPTNPDGTAFRELERLTFRDKIDPADTKFVAVAISSHEFPAICDAADSDWSQIADDLRTVGIDVIDVVDI